MRESEDERRTKLLKGRRKEEVGEKENRNRTGGMKK